MRLFALKDDNDPQRTVLAVLSCFGPEREYYFDMPEGTDPWTVPFILSSFASRKAWSIGPEWSGRWVESRLVPKSRQNLGEVLKVNGLDEYDSLRLLEMTEGRCSQDDCYLEPLRPVDAPAWFAVREAQRVVEAAALDDFRLLVAFRTGEVRILDDNDIAVACEGAARVLADADAFARAEVEPGGRGVRWGTCIRISDEALRSAGHRLPLSWGDLAQLAPALLVDAAEAAQMMGCTRQNINALMKHGVLNAAKTSGKATLFLRADIRARSDRRPGATRRGIPV